MNPDMKRLCEAANNAIDTHDLSDTLTETVVRAVLNELAAITGDYAYKPEASKVAMEAHGYVSAVVDAVLCQGAT